jgi:hypothetical protein
MVSPVAKTTDQLILKIPADYNRFTESMQEEMAEWLKERITN